MLVSRIQQDLLDFIAHDPDDRDGLIEFWYSANTTDLSAALTKEEGLKLIVNVSSFESFEQISKRLFLVADNIILRDTRQWIPEEEELTFVPIPSSGQYVPGYHRELEAELKTLKVPPLTKIYRPNLIWTADTKTLNNGLHVAYAGWSFNAIPRQFKEWISGAGKDYLKTGKIIYAPFLPSLSEEIEFLNNNISLPRYFNAMPCFHQNYNWFDDNQLDALLSLQMPFIDNIDIETLSKVKLDNYDAFTNFSRSLLDSITKVKSLYGTVDFIKEIRYIQSNQIDDNLDKIEQKIKKISKQESLRKLAVVTGLGLLNLSAYLGAPATALVSGLAASAIGAIAEHAAKINDQGVLQDNKAYFLWKLKNLE